jgi:hypothetical protein
MHDQPHSESWAPTQEACRALGISRSTIQRLKARGDLSAGRCYYRRGLGLRAGCLWNVPECRQVLRLLAASDPAALETYDLPGGLPAASPAATRSLRSGSCGNRRNR